LGLALVSAIVAVSGRHARWYWAAAVVLSLFLAGSASYAIHRHRLPAWENLPPREAQLSLQVTRVFAQRDVKRATGLARITQAAAHLQDLVGQQIYFSLTLRPREALPIRSAVLATSGVLVTLPE